MMSAREKSDLPEVAWKRANKAASAAAELVERRGRAKENAELQSTVWTQSRAAVSQAQARIREAVAFLDSLFVMEEGMRHYFSKAMQAKTNNMKPEIVDNYMQKAIDVAEKVAPYRHARLSAVKLAGDPNNAVPFKDNASSGRAT